MARSFSNAANLLSAITRRCYSTTSQGMVSSVGRSGAVKTGEEKVKMMMKDASVESSWVPDPVTGYYRPANLARDVDAAELRQILLNQKH